MKKTIIIMSIITIILASIGVYQRGLGIIVEGLLAGGKMILDVLPLIIIAFLLAGMIQVIITKETINKWLGNDAGIKGVFLGALAGALMPGGPYAFYPIAATFLLSGAEIGTVLAFVVAKNLWSLSRLPLEIALVGPHITFARYIITLIFPIAVGIVANAFFKGWGEQVRKQVKEIQTVGDKS